MNTLKELRNEKKLTQQRAAQLVGISLRSYKTYESDEKKVGTLKYNYIVETLSRLNPVDEPQGILDLETIKEKCSAVFAGYNVNYCYLFGSYAKGSAGPASDVDLLICADVGGIRFFGLVEELRTALHKKVDALDLNQLKDNFELVQEILRDGVKIYSLSSAND